MFTTATMNKMMTFSFHKQVSPILIWFCLVLIPTCPQAQTTRTLEVGEGERLLVLAPHPDDEVLSSAGLMQQVFQLGGMIRAVVVTAGDAYVSAIQEETGRKRLTRADFLAYGEKRLNESRRAAQLLGKGFVHLDLLGFSDGSVYSMLVTNWRRTHPDKSWFTGFDHVPYRAAEDKGMAQDGQDLLNELVAIIRDTKPSMIVFPDVMENDSDHAGLGMFALLAANESLETAYAGRKPPRLLAYLIHWQQGWPPGSLAAEPIDLRDMPLYLPDDLPFRGHARSCLMLTGRQTDLKHAALQRFHTQQRAMAPFLAAFVHTTECFTELQAADTKGIENVIEQWRHARKSFDLHPLSRRKI